MIKELRKNNKGMTLLEMMVALGIFSVFMLSATAIFQSVVESQRTSFGGQNEQESMRYALEVMAREIRSAQRDGASSACPSAWGLSGNIYKTYPSPFNNRLVLKNKDGQCVYYFIDNKRLRIYRGDADYNISKSAFITPDEVKINSINFQVYDTGGIQPKVSLLMDLEVIGKEINKQKMKIQTTISSRYYE
jgi:prepilin-type N-terminal cleavage/methylation domain-containing protein